MTCTNKVHLTFYMSVIFSMCFQPDISHAQDNHAAQNVIELKSLKINRQVDLSKIFKPSPKPVTKKQKADIAKTSEQPIDLQLVGTMILGEKKLAWLKVENQVYQLESGQSVPGMNRQISQINPESIVLIHAQPCKVVDSCNSSLTLTIRDALF